MAEKNKANEGTSFNTSERSNSRNCSNARKEAYHEAVAFFEVDADNIPDLTKAVSEVCLFCMCRQAGDENFEGFGRTASSSVGFPVRGSGRHIVACRMRGIVVKLLLLVGHRVWSIRGVSHLRLVSVSVRGAVRRLAGRMFLSGSTWLWLYRLSLF